MTGKGQKSRVIPLRGRIMLAAEEYLLEELEGVGRRSNAFYQPPTGLVPRGAIRLLYTSRDGAEAALCEVCATSLPGQTP